MKDLYYVVRSAFIILVASTLTFNLAVAQPCGPNTPSFTVNLTGFPNGSWTSPSVIRDDQCCGVTPPDRCVEFWVTLDPAAVGIRFDITSGAIPPGALYYQLFCANPTAVGDTMCISGVGPHRITFCKPGNNQNTYTITSIPAPQTGPPTVASDGCTGILTCSDFQENTLSWTSVSPGPTGFYNNYLSCSTACDTVIVTAQPGYPSSVLYQVCGLPIGACASQQVCDTVRVYFVSDKYATITPQNPVICFGGPPATITANGSGGAPPYSYSWSTGATTQSIVVGAGTYWVQITDTSNCPPVYDTVTVIANPNYISANAGPNDSTCSSNPVFNLNGSVVVATGGIWTGGTGTFNPNDTTLNATYTASASEIAAGFVTLILTTTGNGPCPSDADTITLYIIADPVAAFSSTTPCVGQSMSFTDQSTSPQGNIVSWSWNFGDLTTSSQQNPSHTYSSAGTYTVTLVVTTNLGCTSMIQQVVTVNAPPVVSISGTNTICSGFSSTLTASGGNTYSWSTGATTTAITVSPTTTTTYTVTGTNTTTGCSDTSVITVTVNNLPPVVLSGPDSICIGASASLTASGASTYSWSTGSTAATITVSPTVTTTYTVVGTDGSTGCTNTAVQTVVVNPLPTINITGPGALCFGNSVTLTGNGGATYSWSNSSTGTSIVVSPTTTTTYTLTGYDAIGCANTDTITVAVNPLPVAAFTENAACFVDSVYFVDASTISSGNVVGWNWNFGDPGSGPSNTSSQQNPAHYYNTPGTYTVTLVVTSAAGCTDSIVTTIIVNPSPQAQFTTTEVCFGAANIFNDVSTISSGSIVSWSWNFGDAGTSTQQNPTHTYSAAGTYTVTLIVTSAVGCIDTLYQTVTVHAIPVANFSTTGACLADGIQFNDLSTVGAPDSVVQWQWYFGDATQSTTQNPLHYYPSTGNYGVSLIVTSSFGCSDTILLAVTVNPSPVAAFASSASIVVINQTVNFTDQSTGSPVSWFWDFGDSLGTSTQQNPSYTYAEGGTYTVMEVVTNQYGCTDTAYYDIIVTMPPQVPSGFSPNGDGKNDVLFVLGGPYKELDFKIYNNWGELIFVSTNQANGWDGTRAGLKQPMSVYIYVVYAKTEDDKEHHLKGDVTLLR